MGFGEKVRGTLEVTETGQEKGGGGGGDRQRIPKIGSNKAGPMPM